MEQKVQEALKLLEKERQAKAKERQEKEIGIVNMYNLGKRPIALISKILNKEEAFIKEILKKYGVIL